MSDEFVDPLEAAPPLTQRETVDAAMERGAAAAWLGEAHISDNPYPDAPGFYQLHKAWRYGFEHHEEVLARYA
jgi:hypothetical protein